MSGEVKIRIADAFFRRTVKTAASMEEKAQIALMLNIDGVSVSNEELGKLLEILERAAVEAETVMS